MAKTTKKFGARYGRTSRQKYAKIDTLQKASYKCPYCNYKRVKRLNTGIWECDKCEAKFASKAYYVPKASKETIIKEEVFEEEQIKEED